MMRETWVWSLGWEDPLEKGKATRSSILAWRIPWTVWSMGLQRVKHNWATFTSNFIPVSQVAKLRVLPCSLHCNQDESYCNIIYMWSDSAERTLFSWPLFIFLPSLWTSLRQSWFESHALQGSVQLKDLISPVHRATTLTLYSSLWFVCVRKKANLV